MTPLTDLSGPMTTLRVLAAEHPGLPAPNISISPIYPGVLQLSFHDDFGDFEAWREALGIDPLDVSWNLQGGETTAVLNARTLFAGATVAIVGYSPNALAVAS